MRTALKAFTVALLLSTGSCISSVAPDPGTRTIVAVAGRVLRTNGTGVGGPLVAIQLLSAASGGTAQVIGSSSVIGADDGRFLFVFLINGFEPQTGSANIVVTAPIASGLSGKEVSGVPVKLILGQVATDTSYVEITLAAR